jgi:hypothetical protein
MRTPIAVVIWLIGMSMLIFGGATFGGWLYEFDPELGKAVGWLIIGFVMTKVASELIDP